MNRKRNGWISLFTVALAFFITAVSIILINLSISNFRVCNSISQGVNQRSVEDNFSEIIKYYIENYSKQLLKTIQTQYPTRSASELQAIFKFRLLSNFSSDFGKNINTESIKYFNIKNFTLMSSDFDSRDNSILYLNLLFAINMPIQKINVQTRYIIDYNEGNINIRIDSLD